MGGQTLKVASRKSRLSCVQTDEALQIVAPHMPPDTEWLIWHADTPGDRDKKISLLSPEIPDDFFTRDLDDQLRRGVCDLTIHSAKDLPRRPPAGLAVAAILPGIEPRDAIAFRPSVGTHDHPVRVIGTSSLRREDSVLKLYPGAVTVPVRGTIEERLAALDRGDFDALIVAACALLRLGLRHRIDRLLPYDTAPLQGQLALVVRDNDDDLIRRLKPLDFRMRLFEDAIGSEGPGDVPSTHTRPATGPGSEGRNPESDATLFLGTRPEHFPELEPMIPWPMIRLAPRPAQERIAALESVLPGCNAVIFASAFAARAFVDAVMLWKDMRAVAGLKILAVGPATADALERLYLAPDFVPSDFGGLASLVEKLDTGLAGRCFYPCSSASPSNERAKAAAARGLELAPSIFYDTVETSPGPLPDRPFGRVFFTSPSTVRAYFAAYPDERKAPRRWLAIGPSTLAALNAIGLPATTFDSE